MYPADDQQFEETVIANVRPESSGWSIDRADGWSFFVPENSPVEPKSGMTARFYGKGLGMQVRGLFIDGHQVFYRTDAEETDKRENEMYGKDAADWLARWDAGKHVWSISMGGLGPGYEQAIQITMAEVLRYLLARGDDVASWDDEAVWTRTRTEIEAAIMENPVVKALGGISGSQYGAALSLACHFYRKGPRVIFNETEVADRHIQVSRTLPSADPMSLATIAAYDLPSDGAPGNDMRIERVKQIGTADLWAVRWRGQCLSKTGEWEFEPMPSSRDDAFLSRCRFDSAQSAYAAWETSKKPVIH